MRRVLILLSAVAVLALQACCGGQSHLVADESVIVASPCPDSIYLYTPAIVEGFDGRYVVAVDYGGPGTAPWMAPGPISGTTRLAIRFGFSFPTTAAPTGGRHPPASP